MQRTEAQPMQVEHWPSFGRQLSPVVINLLEQCPRHVSAVLGFHQQ